MATLNFKGKTFVQNHHLAVKYHHLVPKKDKSLTDKVSLNDNLILHGDNLKALKALLPTYAGKVKCIYIDPPYNTGNERWVYNDNVNSPMMQEWLGKVVDREDFTRHDKWLCMMMPRLKLLRELLREDGVIFASIDDNEVHHLRMLMDEVFGEENFVAILPTVMNLKGNQDQFGFAGTHEYTIVFAKHKLVARIKEFKLDDEDLREWEEDEYGYFKKGANLKATGVNAPREKRPNLYFPIFVTNKNDLYITENDHLPESSKNKGDIAVWPITDAKEMSWRWSKDRINRETYNIIMQRSGKDISFYKKQRPQLGDLPSKKPKSLFYRPEYSSGNGTAQIKEIFGKKMFNNPKPVDLIKDFIFIVTKKNDLVLDSFAGSGTTAHAVLDLNKEDGGNRKFILVECEGYADKITAERMRRVIKGVPNAKDEKTRQGLGGTFSYFELGDPIEMESILEGDKLPSFLDLARYVFYTATGEEFEPKKVDEKRNFIGDSNKYEVYLFYKPDIEYLKATALTLERAKGLGPYNDKRRLVFAPSKYLDTDYLLKYRVDYCQLPFEIYKLKE
ncbi:site-specific DNA-methyltransferase [Dehalococcoidia bacterium]|nr:site-specific DNA-methyltransferase [Dehalococcoidia bacterium]